MATDAMRRAVAKYDAANTKHYGLKLNIGTDAEIIAKLEKVRKDPGGIQGYIKALIRANINKVPDLNRQKG